jgi:hypothetical protein
MDGHIHQYGSLGHDWMAWTQVAGNPNYRGVEHEDHGDPANPMTDAQLTASAQVFEAMSAFDGWPLAPTDNPNGGRGIIFHADGGAAWGGHACPGPVRQGQRAELIRRAQAIRAGASPAPQPPAPAVISYTSTGSMSLLAIATTHKTGVSTILRLTAEQSPGARFSQAAAEWLDNVFAGKVSATGPVPTGLVLQVPG